MTTDPRFPRRIGRGMLVVAALAVLGVLTFGFDAVLDQRANPNQSPESRMGAGVVEVILQRNRAQHYVVTGAINGEEVEFLVDTGATAVAIPGDIADRLGLRRGPPVPTMTANGRVTTYLTRLESVRVGDIVLRDVEATIAPQMRGVDVLLGMSFLGRVDLIQSQGQLILRQSI